VEPSLGNRFPVDSFLSVVPGAFALGILFEEFDGLGQNPRRRWRISVCWSFFLLLQPLCSDPVLKSRRRYSESSTDSLCFSSRYVYSLMLQKL